jgi:hypothetical protein
MSRSSISFSITDVLRTLKFSTMAELVWVAVSFNDPIRADGDSLERTKSVESVPGSAICNRSRR